MGFRSMPSLQIQIDRIESETAVAGYGGVIRKLDYLPLVLGHLPLESGYLPLVLGYLPL